jgi:hypothetical protein
MAAAAGFAVHSVVGLITPSPPPIEVHSIHYADGAVVQDRTVTPNGQNPVKLLQWSAQVVYAGTGRPVQGCTGAGSWPYERGRLTVQFDLPEWVGNAACTPEALPDGVDLRLRGVWAFEGRQIVAMSPVFRAGGIEG